MKSIYLGLGMSAGVSLLILPVTSRRLVHRDLRNLLSSFQKCLLAYQDMFHSFESEDGMTDILTAGRDFRPEVIAAQEATKAVSALQAKIVTDLKFAKREVAFGKLEPEHYKELTTLLRRIILPTVGLESLTGLFQRIASARGWNEDSTLR